MKTRDLGRSGLRVSARRKYLEENVAAFEVELSRDDLLHLDEVAPHDVAAGSRYPQAMMIFLNR